MKFLTFSLPSDAVPRCGLVLPGGRVLDIHRAYCSLVDRDPRWAGAPAPFGLPGDLGALLRLDDGTREILGAVVAHGRGEHAGGTPVDTALESITFHPPILQPSKIIATGWNFADHNTEAKDVVGVKVPAFPTGFAKLPSALLGHNGAVICPAAVPDLDYEVEAAVVIGRRGRCIPQAQAMGYVAGFTIMNDVSARGIQLQEMRAGLLLAGKNFDTFAPMGPFVVTPDEMNLAETWLTMRINGERRQHTPLHSAVFSFPELIAYWSSVFTLEPGDVITGGSPPGVALGLGPNSPLFLKAGDVMEAEITGIGVLQNSIQLC